MPTKEQIVNNIREYSAAEIAEAIQQGEVSLYELSKSGLLTPLLKKRILEKLDDVEVESLCEEPVTSESVKAFDEEKTIGDATDLEYASEEVAPCEAPVVSPPQHPQITITKISSEPDAPSFLQRAFSFKGRMRRRDYFLAILAFYGLMILMFVIVDLLGENPLSIILGITIGVMAVWLLIASRIKRCHDRGNSGWWQLYTCIPYVGVIFSFILLFDAGDIDANEYGPNPKDK